MCSSPSCLTWRGSWARCCVLFKKSRRKRGLLHHKLTLVMLISFPSRNRVTTLSLVVTYMVFLVLYFLNRHQKIFFKKQLHVYVTREERSRQRRQERHDHFIFLFQFSCKSSQRIQVSQRMQSSLWFPLLSLLEYIYPNCQLLRVQLLPWRLPGLIFVSLQYNAREKLLGFIQHV